MTFLSSPFNLFGKQYLSLKDFAGQNKKRLVVVAVSVLLLVLLGTGLLVWLLNKTDTAVDEPWQEYVSDTLGFAVAYPAGWQVTEEAAESGPDIMITDWNSLAFVRIRGLFDPYLNSAAAITSSVTKYQTTLAAQPGAVTDFQAEEGQEGSGGFTATGEFSINDVTYRFKERGRLSTRGQILIMRAADESGSFAVSANTLDRIMDSFTLR